MSRWRTANRWAGLVVFGFPAVMSVPAVVATVARFGVWPALSAAALPVVVVCLPLWVWVGYFRRPPRSRRSRVAWGGVAAATLGLLATTPVWWWVAPVLLVVVSEAIRLAVAARWPFTAVTRATLARRSR
jgi:hypothetical protein